MNFTKEQRKAIYFVARAMVTADGRIDEEREMKAFAMEMFRCGSDPDELIEFENGNEDVDPVKALTCIGNFSADQKKYVCAFLGALIAVDGDVDEDELKLWSLTSKLCGLPVMSIGDAFEYMAGL